MLAAIVRLLTSSTFLAGVFALLAQGIASTHGVDLSPAAIAAVPLAVGWKEGKRHEALGVANRSRAAVELVCETASTERRDSTGDV